MKHKCIFINGPMSNEEYEVDDKALQFVIPIPYPLDVRESVPWEFSITSLAYYKRFMDRNIFIFDGMRC